MNNNHIQGCLDDIINAVDVSRDLSAETRRLIVTQRAAWVKKLVAAMDQDRTKWENMYWTLLQRQSKKRT